jgi:hypothetical protein
MSVNPNQTNATPADALFIPSSTVIPVIYAGITNISTATSTITASAPGVLSTSVVVATYIHPGVGAAGQAFNIITPGTNQIFFDLQATTANGESISWIAKA